MYLAAVVGATICISMVASFGMDTASVNVAFSASLDKDRTIEKGSIIPYNVVYTNQGGGYNSDSGMFTAPNGGLFVFHFHALTTKGNEFMIDLYHNDDYMMSAFGRQKGEYAHGGNSIVLRLKKNDRVYMKAQRKVFLFGLPEEVYTTFTGYMISALCD